MRFLPSLIISALFSLTCSAELSEKQSLPVELISSIQNAEVRKRQPPKYPINEARKNKEGWVRLSFVIAEDGSVLDPIVTDSSGVRAFEKAALRAVKNWQYSPAIQDGEAIQQCDNNVQLDFILDNAKVGVTKKYKRKYTAIRAHLNAGELEQADELITELKDASKWNHYEDVMTYHLDSVIANKLNNTQREMHSLMRSTSSKQSRQYLGEKRYLAELQSLFVLQTQQQHYQSALSTYKRIDKTKGGEEIAAHLAQYAEKIEQVIKGDGLLAYDGKITGAKKWRHRLTRQQFAFDNIKGQLDTVELRCKNKREIYTVAEQTTWSIPKSWGRCTMFVSGDDNTQFDLLELPKTAV